MGFELLEIDVDTLFRTWRDASLKGKQTDATPSFSSLLFRPLHETTLDHFPLPLHSTPILMNKMFAPEMSTDHPESQKSSS